MTQSLFCFFCDLFFQSSSSICHFLNSFFFSALYNCEAMGVTFLAGFVTLSPRLVSHEE